MQGSITITMSESGSVSVEHVGDLNHITIVGLLTMALHNIEFSAMIANKETEV